MAVLGTMTIATVINGAATVQKGSDPVSTIVAAGVLTLILMYVNDSVDPKLASVLAGTFLLGSFMVNYKTFNNLIGYLTVQPKGK